MSRRATGINHNSSLLFINGHTTKPVICKTIANASIPNFNPDFDFVVVFGVFVIKAFHRKKEKF